MSLLSGIVPRLSSPGGTFPRRPFTPKLPDNAALDCWRCPHRWHGLDCRTAACGCSSSWVDPS